MFSRRTLLLAAGALAAGAAPAAGQSTQSMMDACAKTAESFYREAARTEMRDNGQRTDGTYAIGGRIFLENRAADFNCSFAPDGRRIVEFYADGRPHNEVLGPSSGGQGVRYRVIGVPSNDVLNVRAGPSAGDRIVGALVNGDVVGRIQCLDRGGSTWCEVDLLDEMGSKGWVNARYLEQISGGSAEARYWRVAGLPGDDLYNLRAEPSTRARVAGVVGNGDVVGNLGCRDAGGMRWCQVDLRDEMGSTGWVDARYLRPSGPPR